jgi:hypothetical protein
MKRFFAILLLGVFLPAMGQNVVASLQVRGDVRVAAWDDFVPAIDRQPVTAGQRIMVGENSSAIVRYGVDCSRTYSDPGVYTVGPATCRNGNDSQQQQQAGDGGESGGTAGPGGGASLASTVATILGTVIAGQQVIEHQGETKVDRSLSH